MHGRDSGVEGEGRCLEWQPNRGMDGRHIPVGPANCSQEHDSVEGRQEGSSACSAVVDQVVDRSDLERPSEHGLVEDREGVDIALAAVEGGTLYRGRPLRNCIVVEACCYLDDDLVVCSYRYSKCL